jgi:hypothetical protein
MKSEVKYVTNTIVKYVDAHLKKINVKITKDEGKHKNKLGVLNYIGWIFVMMFVFLDVVGIVTHLYQVGIILTIDESKIDDIIQELKQKDPLVEIATEFTETSSDLLDEMISEHYTILRCSKKKLCCLTSIFLRIFQSVITIIFLLYVGMKHRVCYGFLFMASLYFAIGLSIYIFTDFDASERRFIMCPMPSEYRKLFEF